MILLALVAFALDSGSAYVFPCIGNLRCKCNTVTQSIDCSNQNLKYFPWLGRDLLAGFKHLDLRHNDIRGPYPDLKQVLDVIPHLATMSLNGNYNLDCEKAYDAFGKLRLITNCLPRSSTTTTRSKVARNNCGWSCHFDKHVRPVAVDVYFGLEKGIDTIEKELKEGYRQTRDFASKAVGWLARQLGLRAQ